MTWTTDTALKLGRVSNLPTVWSNTLAGVVLSGISPFNWNILTLLLAMSLAYTGGMFLNDAFDRKVDAKERPERPVPSGKIKAAEVFAAGFTLLVGAMFFTLLASMGFGGSIANATLTAGALCIAIVVYNVWHKDNPFSPVIMGACRALVILCAGFSAADAPFGLIYFAAFASLAYVIGLTYVAKQENRGSITQQWPLVFLAAPLIFGVYTAIADTQVLLPTLFLLLWLIYCLSLIYRPAPGNIPLAVVSMIAGIALVDAIFIASVSSLNVAIFAAAAFALTLGLQRVIPGT